MRINIECDDLSKKSWYARDHPKDLIIDDPSQGTKE